MISVLGKKAIKLIKNKACGLFKREAALSSFCLFLSIIEPFEINVITFLK